MFNDIDVNDVKILWHGWRSTLTDLADAGWELEHRTHWTGHRKCDGRYILLRNTSLGVLGRLTLLDSKPHDRHLFLNLDFMTFAKSFRKRGTHSPYFTKSDLGVGKGDVGALLDLIRELQRDYPTPPEKTEATPVRRVA